MRRVAAIQIIQFSKNIALLCSGIMVQSALFAQENKDVDTTGRALDEVVVTAQYQPQSLRKSVYRVNVIDQKRIQAKSANNAQQILAGELGIIFSNDMALGISDVKIMGVSGMGVKILVDGVPMLDRSEMRESLNQINAQQIERIEIIEGPMSVMYGTDALAGVINIITKKVEHDAIYLNAQITEETAGKEYSPVTGKGMHTQQLSGGWDNGKFNILASVLHYDFGGFGGNEYNRAHVWRPKEQLLPSIRLGYKGENWDVAYRNDYLLETITFKGEMGLDNTAKNQFYTTNRIAQQLQYNHRWSNKWFWNNSLGFTDYKRHTKTDNLDYENGTITPSDEKGAHDTVKFEALNLRSSILYLSSKKLSVQPGIEYSYDAASGARIQEDVPTIHNAAVFLTAEYKPAEKISLRPGLRYTYNSLFDAPLVPSLNVMYRLNDNVSFRGSYAHGYRAPTLREMYFEFIDANHNIVGNTALKAENSKSANISFAYRKPLTQNRSYSTEFSVFYNSFNDLISIIPDIDNPQLWHYMNVDKNKTSGLSLSNRFVTPKLEWRIGGLLLGEYNLVTELSGPQTEVSGFKWTPEFNIELMYQVLATKTRLNIFYKLTGQRNQMTRVKDVNENYVLAISNRDAFSNLDANVQQQIMPSLKLSLGVRNILNVTMVNSTITSGAAHGGGGVFPFSYGRSYFATLSYNINNQNKK